MNPVRPLYEWLGPHGRWAIATFLAIAAIIATIAVPIILVTREGGSEVKDALRTAATPSPGATPSAADELFALAFEADKAGNNDDAISLYMQAIDAGLDPAKARLAHVEIGLLELYEVKGNPGDPTYANRCSIATSSLEAAESIGVPEHEEFVVQLREALSSSICAP
jgi:hypothetical protein